MELQIIYIVSILQILIALGIFNVWILRFNKSTKYRGRDASSMVEEFKAYGLPSWSVYLVGFIKISIAILLLLGLKFPFMVPELGLVMAVLMIGAIAMHVKVRDSFIKVVPALIMLIMSLAIVILTRLV